MTWRERNPERTIPFWASVAADIRAHVAPEKRPKSPGKWLATAAKVAVLSSGFRAVLAYRIAHSMRGELGPFGRPISMACFWFGRHWYGCSIASTARLHGGLILPHPQGIVVGAGTVLGPNSWIFQNVTLGGVHGKSGMPHVGSGARLYVGAVVVGPVVVGDNVIVGPNAVITNSVASGTTVRTDRPRQETT